MIAMLSTRMEEKGRRCADGYECWCNKIIEAERLKLDSPADSVARGWRARASLGAAMTLQSMRPLPAMAGCATKFVVPRSKKRSRSRQKTSSRRRRPSTAEVPGGEGECGSNRTGWRQQQTLRVKSGQVEVDTAGPRVESEREAQSARALCATGGFPTDHPSEVANEGRRGLG